MDALKLPRLPLGKLDSWNRNRCSDGGKPFRRAGLRSFEGDGARAFLGSHRGADSCGALLYPEPIKTPPAGPAEEHSAPEPGAGWHPGAE
jgi:hypothetical protein